MYFIKTGEVLITFDPDNDLYSSTRVVKQGQREKKIKSFSEQKLLYLPRYSCFGDYQILYNLKSNLVFKTVGKSEGEHHDSVETVFMCIDKKKFLELCDIFPQTKANIKRIALARRYRFMQ